MQGSYKNLDIKIKDFSRTFKHRIIFCQDQFILIDSDSNTIQHNLEYSKPITGLFLGLSWGRNKAPLPMPN